LLAFSLGLASLFAAPRAQALDPTRSIAQMYHRAYTHEDGLPPGAATIAQTPDGYLWVGTGSGLYRFDGVRFERIGADRLLSLAISALETTASGDLWIGYQAGGASRMHGREIVNYPPEAGGPTGKINRIKAPQRSDEVWALGNNVAWRLRGGRWARAHGDWGQLVWAMESARDGAVWLKDGETLFHCRPGGARCVAAPGYGGGVMGFARDRDGRVWTSDTKAPWRMYALPDIAGVPDSAIPGPAYGGRVSERIRGRIFLDRDGALWNVNLNHGLLRARSVLKDRADPGLADAFSAREGLSSDFVMAFFEDQEGSIWAATNGGLDRFRPANVVAERSIPATASWWGYHAIRVGNALYIHASTSDDNSSPNAGFRGPLYRVEASGRAEVAAPDVPGVWSMIQMRSGEFWLGTDLGLMRLIGGRAVAEAMPPGAEGRAVFRLAETPGGALWAWIAGRGLWERGSGGRWRRLPILQDLADASAVIVEPDADGGMWIYYPDERVLVRLKDGRLEKFSNASGPGVGAVRVIHSSDRGVFFGGEDGVSLFDGRRFHGLRTDRLPALAFATGISEAGGDMWIGGRAGVMRFDTAELVRAIKQPRGRTPRYELFDRLDGLPGTMQLVGGGPSFNAVLPGPDGRVWFVTDGGLVWIDPKNIARNRLAPPVVIRALTANGRTYTSPQDLKLPAGSDSLEIDYAALSFVEPSRVRFRYKLEGVDRDWVDPGERREAFYTQLSPGAYRFRVIASNDAGVWNETGAALAFSIAPTFLQSIWFKLLAALALVSVISAVYGLRLRQATARLQTGFEVRIAERERIARELHDTLLQGFQGLMLRFQSVANLLPAGGEARRALDETLDRADAVLLEGRARVRELRAARAEDLPQALTEAAKKAIPADVPRFRLTAEGIPRALSAAVAEEIVRIAEEAIRNAVRHAQAGSVEVLLAYERRGLRLVVRDDGVGMDQTVLASGGKTGHFGLVGMRERASRIGGRLTVSSGPDSGTDIAIFVPAGEIYRDLWTRMRDRLGRLFPGART
jgi:signal transduction histidine kinase/ligand-binding sensor domain-containing protein